MQKFFPHVLNVGFGKSQLKMVTCTQRRGKHLVVAPTTGHNTIATSLLLNINYFHDFLNLCTHPSWI